MIYISREVDSGKLSLFAVPAKTDNGMAKPENKLRVRAYYESMPGFYVFFAKNGNLL